MSDFDLKGFFSLGDKINKFRGKTEETETEEGIVSEKLKELELDLKNEDIILLTTKWEKKWKDSDVYTKFIENGDENEKYWKGKQHDQPEVDKRRPLIDNVIFEALEIYLPQVTRRNPDPMITLAREEEESKDNLEFASNLQKQLGEIADELVFRLKIKKVARHWAIYLLGVVKLGWDLDKDIPTVKVLRPRRLILDPEATIEEDGYTGKYIGEHRKLQASVLLGMLNAIGGESGAESLIKKLVKDNLGTEVGFIEWWTDEYMCWTIGKEVLLKKKNTHWNYDTEKDVPFTEQGEPQLNEETGEPLKEAVGGINHFTSPKKPYLFLSIFNLGKQPVDETSLIGQNLASQDLVNKRVRQIDKNADSMNGGMVVSGERSGLTKQQGKGVTTALRKGGTIFIPTGDVNAAVARMSAPSLPSDVYNQLLDTRSRMRDIFGVRGSSAAGLEGEKTVRGKLQNRVLDTDRIGGGLSEYLEQFGDMIYNWFVQLLYVYDEKFLNLQPPKIKVSVKEGSLLPKDSLTIANQAIELAGAGKMSLIDLYKNLDYPNPEELAANVWLEVNAPELLFANDTRVQQVMEARKQEQPVEEKPPSQSINFKDLPPVGKTQLAAKVGISLVPEAVAAHDEEVERRKQILKLQNK